MPQNNPTTGTPPIAAAILAGGLARRLGGENKAMLHIGDRRIIDRQLALLGQIADPVFIVSGRRDAFGGLGVPVVDDVIPAAGSLGGIYSALVTSPRARTLVVACDMPFLTLPFLQRLAEPSDADLVIPRTGKGFEPLCATWASTSVSAIRRRIERGVLKAALVMEELRVEEIGPDVLASYDPRGLLFVNVNTSHDYERAQDLSRFF
jgi:molybdenum cofactor guanylyltransferase